MGRALTWAFGLGLVLSFLLVPTLSAAAPSREIHLVARDDGGQFWFELEGSPARNPDIHVAAGETVTVHFRNAGTVAHDFCIADGKTPCNVAYPPAVPVGGTATSTFTAGPSGSVTEYFCDPHHGLQMQGRIVVDGAAAQPAAGGKDSIAPPIGLAIGALAALAVLSRRNP